MPETKLEVCAEVAHEMLRRYRAALGIEPGPIWQAAPEAARNDTRAACKQVIGRSLNAQELHTWWTCRQERAGWRVGEAYDPATRTDPALAPWDALVLGDQGRFQLFVEVVDKVWRALRSAEWTVDEAVRRALADEAEPLRAAPEVAACVAAAGRA